MSTRISERYSSMRTIASLQTGASKLSDLQDQLASNRRITKPSDSPADTAAALQLRAQAARQKQYDTNSNDAQAWLSTVDTTLTSVNTQLQVARTAIVRGLNDGSVTANDRNTLADQVDSLRNGILKLANTTYQGRPIFGGTTTGGTAFDSSGAYVGDSGAVSRTVADGLTETVNASGSAVFGANGSNLFDVLTTVATDLRSNPSALSADLANLDNTMKTISNQQAAAGNTAQRIGALQTTAATTSVNLASQLSNLQDVDTADMAIKISSANASYQAALQTTASIRQTSLLDFLR